MVNYSNGKVYKIEAINAPENEKIYIGSTTKQYLSQRMQKHKYDYKRWKDNKDEKYMSFELFDKYGVDNCQIVLLELVNAESKNELLAREKYYIKTMNTINKFNPIRTVEDNEEYKKQYRIENADKMKLYYDQNKDKIAL